MQFIINKTTVDDIHIKIYNNTHLNRLNSFQNLKIELFKNNMQKMIIKFNPLKTI